MCQNQGHCRDADTMLKYSRGFALKTSSIVTNSILQGTPKQQPQRYESFRTIPVPRDILWLGHQLPFYLMVKTSPSPANTPMSSLKNSTISKLRVANASESFLQQRLSNTFRTMIFSAQSLEWFDEIRQKSPQLFDSIEALEIRDWHWAPDHVASLISENIPRAFFKFPGLKDLKLILSCHTNNDWHTADEDLDEERLGEEMTKFLKAHGTWKGDVPTVSIEPWNKFRV